MGIIKRGKVIRLYSFIGFKLTAELKGVRASGEEQKRSCDTDTGIKMDVLHAWGIKIKYR